MKSVRVFLVIGFFALAVASPIPSKETAAQADETAELKAELRSLRAEVKKLRAESARLRERARGVPRDRKRGSGKTVYKVRMLKTATGIEFGLLGRKPAAPVPTVFWFGGAIDLAQDRANAVEIVPFLVERGYLCVSLDTPGHGRNREAGEPRDGMDAWRNRIAAKKNFIPEFNHKISKVLDHLIAEGYTDPDRVAVLGGSRGGFIAFHYAASDPRVKSVGGHIPLTVLGHITEFKGMEHDPLTKSLDVINLAKKFAGRNVLVIVGDNDGRVGTDHAIAFARRVSNVAKDANVELHVLDGGHTSLPGLGELTEVWLDKHLSPRKASK